jgi:membrane protease YdiL (CAAX protease family)
VLTPTILRPAQRAGLAFALFALALALDPSNRWVRTWLRDDVFGGLPFWLDNMTTMLALKVVVWSVIGLLVLGPRGMSLGLPRRPREAWTMAFGSGLVLVGVVAAALSFHGILVVSVKFDWPLIGANLVSNFEEELIYRGAVLGLMLMMLGDERAWAAVLISALLFCPGHLYHPPALLLTTFGVGLLWAWMTVRYRSIWPAWLSHMVVDAVAGSLFQS